MRISMLLALLLAGPAIADDADAGWDPVSEQRLEACRGGFDLGNGLVATLDVERLVSINGNVVASSRLNIDEMAKLSTAQAQAVQDAMAQVIQNSASGQLIRSQTTINTTVNSLSLLKTLNFEGSLRDALSVAAGPR